MSEYFELGIPGQDDEMEFLPILPDEEDGEGDQHLNEGGTFPVLPLRNTVVFPGVVIPITVGRDKSIKAVNAAHRDDKLIAVFSQQHPKVEEPQFEDLFKAGTLAKVVKKLKMPDGTTTVIIQGKRRISLLEAISEEPYMKAAVQVLEDVEAEGEKEFKATIASMRDLAKEIIKLSPQIPTEATVVLKNINSPSFLIHFIASNLNVDLLAKQEILEQDKIDLRAENVLEHLHQELQMLELKDKIQTKVRGDLEKQQRDYFLQQQMKQIQEELGGDSTDKEIQRLRKARLKKKWTKEVADVFQRELEKLERTNPAAAEYSVTLNYLDLLLDLPWGIFTKDKYDLKLAKKVLDKDHHGLEKVKDRILEYLAVLKLKGDLKSPILCLVGPPGVGKTSLGKSIAKALNRKYIRMSLGGLHDEAEIRGHRKTYIGAMPGRIVQSLKKVQSSNPVFILDEIDKVGSDFRGDPASALLEVLDPEQNNSFYDNFLELEYDLSKVMFVATANTLNTIHPALRDRMEIIKIDGYSIEEKLEIAKKHLLPKQRKAHGLKASDLKISMKVLEKLIEEYTRESGVRELDRTLAAVMRSIAKPVAMGESYDKSVKKEQLRTILGANRYDSTIYKENNPPGVAVGLAYTSVGGDILFIETSLSNGKGNLTLTGSLGDVMKESASTALSYLKANTGKLGLDSESINKRDIHIHVPEGAVPKDGPSAGITILTSLASAFTGRRLKSHLAMTGEITLRGRVLPVGGIKEKILAAKRAGITEIIVCNLNKKDVEEINQSYITGLQFHYIDNMMEVLDIALAIESDSSTIDLDLIAEN